MNNAGNREACIAKMTFASVYPHYVTKTEKKGRTKEEWHQLIEWLTGYDETKLKGIPAIVHLFSTPPALSTPHRQ